MVVDIVVEDAVVEEYQRQGAVLVKGVFDQHWVEKIRRGISKNLEKPSKYSEHLKLGDGEGSYFNDYCNWGWIKEFSQYVWESSAAALAARLMKSQEVSFYHEHVLNKEPGTSKLTPWHQDQPYYPIDGDKVCSLWMPVDPVPKNTSLQFVEGSHLWNRWFFPRKFATESNYDLEETGDGTGDGSLGRLYEDVPLHDIETGKWPILQWECQPGDVVVFHMRTLHGAPGNPSSTTNRRILSTRWLGDDAVLARRPWKVSPPITGDLNPGQRVVCSTFPLVYSNKQLVTPPACNP